MGTNSRLEAIIGGGWTPAKSLLGDLTFAFGVKSKVDEAITHMAASAIFHALTSYKEGKGGSSVEANTVLYVANTYMAKEARLLRSFLVEHGPFKPVKEAKMIEVDGKQLAVDCAVQFTENRAKTQFSEQTPDGYAKRAKAVTFSTWRKAAKAKEKEALDNLLSDEDKKVKAKAKLEAKAVKLREELAQAGLTAKEVGFVGTTIIKQEVEAPATPDCKSLIELIKAIASREDVSMDDKRLCKALLDTAANFYNLTPEQRANIKC